MKSSSWVRNSLSVITFLLVLVNASAQERILTVGVQYRPIITSDFFGTGPIALNYDDTLSGSLTPRMGHSFGMSIRRGFTDNFSAEVGINWVRRNYDLILTDDNANNNGVTDFSIISYEIPIQALYYVRFTQKLYMDVAAGVSFDKYASDVETRSADISIYQYTTIRNSFFQFAGIANVGFEYRSQKSGYFYLGASFHRPFKDIARTRIDYTEAGVTNSNYEYLDGTYLTIDLRYFFYEKPSRD